MGRMEDIVEMSVALVVCGVLLPLGLGYVANATGLEGAAATLFTTVIPILAIIGVAIEFLPRFRQ